MFDPECNSLRFNYINAYCVVFQIYGLCPGVKFKRLNAVLDIFFIRNRPFH